jgi:hypothetical protein
MLHEPVRQGTHFLRHCDPPIDQAGRYFESDRAPVLASEDGAMVRVCSREIMLREITGNGLISVSLKGRIFEDRVVIDDTHVHGPPWRRNLGSYIGLGLIVVIWLLSIARTSARK